MVVHRKGRSQEAPPSRPLPRASTKFLVAALASGRGLTLLLAVVCCAQIPLSFLLYTPRKYKMVRYCRPTVICCADRCTLRDRSFFKVRRPRLNRTGLHDLIHLLPRFAKPGHERSLTQIKFNREGDLLFSCSKDHVINVWFTHNGERLGTYDGHNGTVWSIDVDCACSSSMHMPVADQRALTL